MKTILLILFLFTACPYGISFGQSTSQGFFLGFYNSAFDDMVETIPSGYALLVDADGKYVTDADGKYILMRKVSQYAFDFNNEFQFYVKEKNEKIIDDSRLLACILQRKRTTG